MKTIDRRTATPEHECEVHGIMLYEGQTCRECTEDNTDRFSDLRDDEVEDGGKDFRIWDGD